MPSDVEWVPGYMPEPDEGVTGLQAVRCAVRRASILHSRRFVVAALWHAHIQQCCAVEPATRVVKLFHAAAPRRWPRALVALCAVERGTIPQHTPIN